MKHKIIVTGGCGYIGSHTAVELLQKGYRVVLVDDLSNASLDMVDRIQYITGIRPLFEKVDLKNESATLKCFEKHRDVDGVIHFAAHKAVGESIQNPLMYYDNNFKGLLNVLWAMEANDITTMIFSSSATVYGEPEGLPITEFCATKRPFSPYGNTKKVGEEILEDRVRCGQLNAISLRYFNPIGAHPSGHIGELPSGIPNNLMPYITQTAVGKLDQLQIFGNDYPTRDGTPVRDYVHVVDLAEAHVEAIAYLIAQKNSQFFDVINLGTGKGHTVMEIIETFETVTRQKLNYKIVGRREGDVPELYANVDKAQHVLGWKAKRDLEDMIRDSWKWEKEIRKKISN